MCLDIKQGECIKKAEKDILCFKLVRTLDDDTKWTGIYQGFIEYDYNTEVVADRWYFDAGSNSIKSIKLTHLREIDNSHIYEGFHAKTIKVYDAAKYCIIPKGTEICYGNLDDIVAMSMIVFKDKRQYRKYQIKRIWENLKQSLSKLI